MYYYDDYYYDPTYEDDYYAYDYDYDLGPGRTTGQDNLKPLSTGSGVQTPELPDIGKEDYGGLIKVKRIPDFFPSSWINYVKLGKMI